MGICESKGNIYNELFKEHKAIKKSAIDKLEKSICKIKTKDNKGEIKGTGFFIIFEKNNFLLTNYQIISEKVKNIKIGIWNKNIIELNLNNRYIKFINKKNNINIDATIIQIKQNEIKDIIYLNYYLNFIRGYNQYITMDVNVQDIQVVMN